MEKKKHPYAVGKNYLVRTVTMIYTGKLVKVYEQELVVVDAAWIPETERWMQAVADCKFKEVEPYPAGVEVVIGRGAILDAVQIKTLPRQQR